MKYTLSPKNEDKIRALERSWKKAFKEGILGHRIGQANPCQLLET